MRKIVDGYLLVIEEVPAGSGLFYVLKCEPTGMPRGCINPETMEENMSKEEAICF